jgi:beta-1,4-mannooligosaccharide/beta-1,4-mannosyl-N-acetylglucosamine phosphorylase
MLLDLSDPARVLGRGKYNVLEPREGYEMAGQVPNVVFPSGAVVDQMDPEGFAEKNSKVFIYYGAADTSVCLAFSTLEDLLQAAGLDIS